MKTVFITIKMSAFFAEIRKTEAFRRLIGALVAHTAENKHDDRDNVRKHLVKFLDGKICSRRDVNVEDIKTAEQN